MPQLTLPLRADGAVVAILVQVSGPALRRLRNALRPMPQPVPLEAVIAALRRTGYEARHGYLTLETGAFGDPLGSAAKALAVLKETAARRR